MSKALGGENHPEPRVIRSSTATNARFASEPSALALTFDQRSPKGILKIAASHTRNQIISGVTFGIGMALLEKLQGKDRTLCERNSLNTW
jgi:hypothetical protein